MGVNIVPAKEIGSTGTYILSWVSCERKQGGAWVAGIQNSP